MTKAHCTPLWQPIPCPLSDIEGLESWLGDMAAHSSLYSGLSTLIAT